MLASVETEDQGGTSPRRNPSERASLPAKRRNTSEPRVDLHFREEDEGRRGDGGGGRARGRSAREQLAATCSGGRSVAMRKRRAARRRTASLDGARGGRREAGTSTGPPATCRGPARRIRDQEEAGARWTAKRVGGVEQSRRRGVRGRSGAGARGAWERKLPDRIGADADASPPA